MTETETPRVQGQDFERDVMPVLVRHARRRFHDDDLEARALSLCWYYWHERKEDYSPSHFARLAVRGVLYGRDLPINSNSKRDVWYRLTNWGGAGMGGVRDRGRLPLEQVISQEEVDRLEGMLTARELHILALYVAGMPGKEIARIIGVSAGRISQHLASIGGKWQGE